MRQLDWRLILIVLLLVAGPKFVASLTGFSDLAVGLAFSTLAIAVSFGIAAWKCRVSLTRSLVIGFGVLVALAISAPDLLRLQFGISESAANIVISVPIFIVGFGAMVWLARWGYLDDR